MLAFVNIKSLIYWQKGKIRDIFREKMENKMEDIHNKFIQEKNRGVAIKELCSHFLLFYVIFLYLQISRVECLIPGLKIG